MPKAKIFKTCAFAGVSLLWVIQGAAQSPPVLGKIIEQVKMNKLNELAPPPPAAQALPSLASQKAIAPPSPPPPPALAPALWSLSGVNQSLTAEILIAEEIHRVKVVEGAALPGGWTVLAGNVNSLTLGQGLKVLTLFPADLGSTGAEFPGLRKKPKSMSGSLDILQEALNSRGIPLETANAESAQPMPATNVEQARQAARSLPTRP